MPAIDPIIQLLRSVARDEMLPGFGAIAFSRKADGSLITAVDTAVQRRITAGLAALHPAIALLGEEMTPAEQAALLADADTGVWCLDPLDGTSNFTGGFPAFAISLALLRNGRCELGLVLDPVRDECFGATFGGGAWCDTRGERRAISPNTPGPDLRDGLAMIDLKRLPASLISDLFTATPFHSHRSIGAVALEWCWLAAGRFQLYLHGGQSLWDYAAGRLIASEAGVPSALFPRTGAVADETISLDKRVAMAAATPALFEQWRARVALPLWG